MNGIGNKAITTMASVLILFCTACTTTKPVYDVGPESYASQLKAGDRVRLFVTNGLPERTSVHWHGQRLPNGMDGVSGLTQPAIPVGKTFVYEFVARRPGTFMYHPHGDEMVQMTMGLMGFWVTHPKAKDPLIDEVDRDFCVLLNAYAIEPGTRTPSVMTMLDFNLWSWNSRVYPGIDSFNVRTNDRVRVRFGKAGTNGQTRERTQSSEKKAVTDFNRAIREKLRKGYVEEG